MKPIALNKIYNDLLNCYGKQYWWPGDTGFEIAIGAILTQSVSWRNVETAISTLKSKGLLEPELLNLKSAEEIAPLIRSTGYYNQKAKKVKNFLNWLHGYNFSFDCLKKIESSGLRDELLSINGIGPETADSILLYALSKQFFVIDAYTRRLFARIGIISGTERYSEIQDLFHKNFNGTIQDYNEYHALIVIHAKDVCKKRSICSKCCLKDFCKANIIYLDDSARSEKISKKD